VSTLAHVFEAAGLSTIVLGSVRKVVEKMHPPRALYCEFPLGRPLGKPLDSAFQTDVLMRGFALLAETTGPVLVDHPDHIDIETEPLACSIPPRFDATLAPAVDEARGLRKAYDRTLATRGLTSVGRAITVDDIEGALTIFDSIANGADWKEAGIPGGNTTAVAHDIRTYYEEAALSLVGASAPGPRQVERWYFEQTEAGRTILAARAAIKASGAPMPAWFYMSPGHW
jgi:hypothetical protein